MATIPPPPALDAFPRTELMHEKAASPYCTALCVCVCVCVCVCMCMSVSVVPL